MPQTKNDDRTRVGTALTAALEAEARARVERELAESNAQTLINSARQQAQHILQRADARIERAQSRAASLGQLEVKRIRAHSDAAIDRLVANPIEQTAIAAAVRHLAEELTSSGKALAPADRFES